jgi:hypothetical protein
MQGFEVWFQSLHSEPLPEETMKRVLFQCTVISSERKKDSDAKYQRDKLRAGD